MTHKVVNQNRLVIVIGPLVGLLSLGGLTSVAHCQIDHWNVLRAERLDDSTSWWYSCISASDDHNFTVSADRSDAHGNQPLILRTTDAGKTWSIQGSYIDREGDPSWKQVKKIYMIDSLHVIGIGDSGLIVRTSDAGNTWIREDYPTVHPLSGIHFSDPMTGIIVGGAVILLTTDGGETWLPPVATSPHYWLVSCRSDGGGRFRAFNFDKGMIYTTTDNWSTWDSISIIDPDDTAVPWQGIQSCQFLGADTIIASGATLIGTSYFTRRSKILLSTDRGVSWKQQLNKFTYTWPDKIATSGSLWLGYGWGNGLLRSTDHGTTWIDDSAAVRLDFPYQFSSTDAIQIISPQTAVGVLGSFPGGGYIVELDLAKLRVEENEQEINGTHVYPNPATGSVVIKSTIPSAPIDIVDVLGSRLLWGQLGPDGTLRFDVSSWSAGVYQVNMLYYGKSIHITNLVVIRQ